MPKVTLTFDLPDERSELMSALCGDAYEAVICDLDNWLRNNIKHCEKEQYQPVRDQLWEELRSRNLDPWVEG